MPDIIQGKNYGENGQETINTIAFCSCHWCSSWQCEELFWRVCCSLSSWSKLFFWDIFMWVRVAIATFRTANLLRTVHNKSLCFRNMYLADLWKGSWLFNLHLSTKLLYCAYLCSTVTVMAHRWKSYNKYNAGAVLQMISQNALQSYTVQMSLWQFSNFVVTK